MQQAVPRAACFVLPQRKRCVSKIARFMHLHLSLDLA
jgi:hypothetical protein